ncbi:signal recognition particle SRP9/SRP14 subunit [Cristinia sonorae]|uniref:Signal recognition particle subunit SRP14 n=1 Tax=Cristinia sonorae TaxID=1940300 RepID=A0A8K0XN42_9AGAR|nr:signal recognition particle SRP9/SRP14 subunit [Cristinia sonorae]
MQLVDNDSFFKQLTALFESTKDAGSIWLTHKRLTHDGEDATMDAGDANDSTEYPCLVRVTDGKELKLSTKVEPGGLEKFHSTYGSMLKASMTSLRKRDKKREKSRAEEVARRKKRLTEHIVVEGSKRGNGRKKRQRRLKQAIKLEEAKKRVQEREEAKAKARAD